MSRAAAPLGARQLGSAAGVGDPVDDVGARAEVLAGSDEGRGSDDARHDAGDGEQQHHDRDDDAGEREAPGLTGSAETAERDRAHDEAGDRQEAEERQHETGDLEPPRRTLGRPSLRPGPGRLRHAAELLAPVLRPAVLLPLLPVVVASVSHLGPPSSSGAGATTLPRY